MEANCLDGALCVQSNGTNMHRTCCEHDSAMGGLSHSQSMMMCLSLMARPGAVVSTCSPQDFHANRSAWQEKSLQAMTLATDGHIRPASYARWDARLCGWRTSQVSLADLMGISEPSLVIFTRSGSMRSGELSVLPDVEHHTNETGFGSSHTSPTLWPTPTVNGNHNRKGLSKTSGDGLATAVVLAHKGYWPWPVPPHPTHQGYAIGNTCTVILDSQPWDSMYARGIIWGLNGDMVDVQMECGQIECWPRENVVPTGMPTPTKNDAKNTGSPSRLARNSVPLDGQVRGPLNPEWIEWIMGWPVGATDLQPLEMDRCRNRWWLRFAPCTTTPSEVCK